MRLGLLLLPLLTLHGQTTAGDAFATRILPVLERDCQGCHGAQQTLAKLDLRTRAALLQGGSRGAAIVPGDAGQSLLMAVLEGRNGLQMPPGGPGKKLPAETIAAFRDWINAGAVWPEKATAAQWTFQPADLWAYQPLRPLDARATIDSFINARLQKAGVAPAPPADRRTLIRRVTFDLTGLPPTPEEVQAFLSDRAPNAYAVLVDRLLASPRYGERWARHWLDVVRYADSGGYSNDFERPNAWRYRDYVIRSFQNDKPYNQFIREQIAGDELYPGEPEALIATGFLRAGPWEHTGMSVEAVTRQMFLDDVTHATASTFLGLTLGCAKCHDHKFDPLPTRDYYRLQAVFASTEFARPQVAFLPGENAAGFAEGSARMKQRHQASSARMQEFKVLSARRLMQQRGVSRLEDLPKNELQQAMATGKGLSPEAFEEYKIHQKHTQIYADSLDRYAPKAFAVSSGPLDGATDGGVALRYPKRADYQPATVHILPGGNVQAPAEAVTPGVLSALERYGGYPSPEIPNTIAGRRAALAQWIASERNPLTARVMVNRIWQYHFGRGLAADPSNFGKMGKKPTHPELLDHLAQSFIQSGWSVKQLHRQILLSAAYQRSSATVPAQDPDNVLLSHFTPRRLEAEALRDSVLAVAGELSPATGGPGVFPLINDDVARQPQHRMGSLAPAYLASPRKADRHRRTIYTFQQRSLMDPLVEVFNGAGMDLACERREASTVPTQAFTLFNSQFTHDMALAFAVRLEREAATIDARLARAFALAYGRPILPVELQSAKLHLAKLTALHAKHPPPAPAPPRPLVHQITSELTGETQRFEQSIAQPDFEPNLHPSQVKAATRALADLALVLFNSNEFAYVY